jgi:putative transposase
VRKGRVSEEQIIDVLREQEARARTEEVCRRHGISTTTLYKGKARIRRAGSVRGAPAEGARGGEPAAEEAPRRGGARGGRAEGPAGKKLSSPAARRVAALRLMAARGLSQRHVCRLLEVDAKTVRRPGRRGDAAIRARLRAPAGERRRFGSRRLGILLEREGIRMNPKKLHRLSREEGLAVRRRRGRKRATGTRAPLALPQAPDQRWSLDFVSACLAAARRFRILVVVDDFTRECLAAVADTSISGTRVARELDALVARRGAPMTIVSDNGPEPTSRAILAWTNRAGLDGHDIAPGKPQQNAVVESFIGRLRDELLIEEIFELTPDACSSAGGSTPTRFGRIQPIAAGRRPRLGCSPRAPGLDSLMVRPSARSHRAPAPAINPKDPS